MNTPREMKSQAKALLSEVKAEMQLYNLLLRLVEVRAAFPICPNEIPAGKHFAILTTCGRYNGYDNSGSAWQIEIFTTEKGWKDAITLLEGNPSRVSYVPVVLTRPTIKTTIQVEVSP